MSGVLIQVRTQVTANRLNLRRQLTMGDNVVLRFVKPDETQTGGMGIIREYTEAFNRDAEKEREVGDGSTVIVDIADVFPAGQVKADIQEAQFIQFVIDDVESDLYGDLDVDPVAPNQTQVYHITARGQTLKQTYLKVGHGRRR